MMAKPRMPPGNSTLMMHRDKLGNAKPAFSVHRLSQRSFRWRLVDGRTGTATTHDAANKAAIAAWARK